MQISVKRVVLMVALVVAVMSTSAFAQKYEVHPYAGGMKMGNYNDALDFKNPAIFGLKGGAYLSDSVMIEGNGAYMNQFNFRGYDYRTKAYLYEVAASYNFFASKFSKVVPYATFGVGGTTVDTESFINIQGDQNEASYSVPLETPIQKGPFLVNTEQLVVKDGDSFFNFSYGGGLKAHRLWGPMGLRFDLRGRTTPNFYNHSTFHAFEATGGLLFSWGER